MTAQLLNGRWAALIFKQSLLKLIIQKSSLATRREIALRWIPQNFANEPLANGVLSDRTKPVAEPVLT